ncbi:MAG: hypothetical protein ACI9W1_001039, partial [Candidatus Azotimanducaceae bacterium]
FDLVEKLGAMLVGHGLAQQITEYANSMSRSS